MAKKAFQDGFIDTEKVSGRPLPDAFRAIEAIAQAILDGRLRIETTAEIGPPLKINNRIVIDGELK